MNLLIDGDTMNTESAGIGQYTYSLIRELASLRAADEQISVTIRPDLLDKADGLNLPGIKLLPNYEHRIRKYLPYAPRWISGFDLYHQPSFVPHVFPGRTIVTVHDMSYRVFPQYHPRYRVLLFTAFENRIRSADKIITVSEYSRQEIADWLKIPAESIVVTYLGVGSQYRMLTVSDEKRCYIKSKYHLPEQFILYVGTIEPRKNLKRLVEAYQLFRLEQPRSELKLVLAGGKGWLYDDIFTRIKELHLEQEIVVTGYVASADLPYFYNLAMALVYPSLYEGFGLPLLEAMSCGTPVISSKTSSIPEVVGEAGLLVDPYKANELAEALYRVASSVSLRENMSILGLERARQFSWKKCAQQTIQVYRS